MSFRILSFLTDAGLKMFSAHSKKKSVTNTKILVRNAPLHIGNMNFIENYFYYLSYSNNVGNISVHGFLEFLYISFFQLTIKSHFLSSNFMKTLF